MLDRFHKTFGIISNLASERHRFVERINQTALEWIEELKCPTTYESIFKKVCYLLGTNANDRIRKLNANSYSFSAHSAIPNLRSLTKDDFMETLKVLEGVYGDLRLEEQKQQLSGWIEAALSHTTIDIGISWRDGMFYPSGAKELDAQLVEEPLEWLSNFPNEKTDYRKALEAYINKQMDVVISDCYLAVEGLARQVLDNAKTLDNNRADLLKKLDLSQEWKALLNNYIQYANEFKRHAGENRHQINPIEAEGFLYLTGFSCG